MLLLFITIPVSRAGRLTEQIERTVLNTMKNHHHGKANEQAGPCDEHQDLQDPIGKTRAPERREFPPHSDVRNSGPLSHHNRHVSGVPSLVASDASSAEEARECWMSNNFDSSSASGWEGECSSMPALSQMPLLPPAPSPLPTIEISPGVQVRLRGADETWKAIENDYYMPAECICCESTIFCIQDADYVLCPDCRVVSRMEGLSSRGMGGVGLGFKYEALARWQDAILRDQLYGRPHV
jgi:hypothetical protein